MVLNSDLIKSAEASPDTMLTLINGEKLMVREEPAEVVERVLAYRARLLDVYKRQSLFSTMGLPLSLVSSIIALSALLLLFSAYRPVQRKDDWRANC